MLNRFECVSIKNKEQIRSLDVVLSILGGLATLVGFLAYIVKISMDYAKVKAETEKTQEKMLELEKEHKEDVDSIKQEFEERFVSAKNYYSTQVKELKENNAVKFKELYESRNKTEVCLAELTSTVKMLVQNMDKQFSSLEKKIDEISKRIGE